MIKYVPIPIKDTQSKDQKRTFDDDYAIFFLIFFIKAYVVGTHLNCIDKSMQFK